MLSTQSPTDPVNLVEQPAAADGAWSLDPAASQVDFTTKILGGLATVRGRFRSVNGIAEVDATGLATVRLTIDMASVDTKCSKRDEHLRAGDFFDVERHPRMEIAVQQAILSSRQALAATGQITLLGRSQAVSIEGTLAFSPDGRRGETVARLAVDSNAFGMGSKRFGRPGPKAQGRAHLVFNHIDSAAAQSASD